jgi:4-hydroxyphenylacetate 3-monooxygenase
MARNPSPWADGFVLPNVETGAAYHVLGPDAYVQVKHQIEKTVASSLIYLNSHARDFANPELRKYLDLYVRGSGGVSAVERVKLMKLLWDAIGTEFGGRHELYEVNWSGSHEEIRRFAILGANASGQSAKWKAFADQCMGEYDLDGWTVPDLINPDDVSVLNR